jgi:adhesin/invasin
MRGAPSRQGVTAAAQFSLTVKIEDAYGDVLTNYTGTIHFSSADSTATLPKKYTFTAAP